MIMLILDRYTHHNAYMRKQAADELVIFNQSQLVIVHRLMTCVLARIADARRVDVHVLERTP